MKADDERHGTPRGYRICRVQNERACEPCRRAHMRYMKAWRLRAQQREAATVEAIGYTRRVQALRRIGWSIDSIAVSSGVGIGTIHRLLRGEVKVVRVATARRLDATFERLSMTVGPSPVAATHAAREGHPPPLAWDDVDNPSERPRGAIQGVIA